ncbi:hypothetical protein D3C87_624270 [compost metagenome]
MDTYMIVAGNKVVEEIEQCGRSKGVMSYIIMDRVYEWVMNKKQDVEVYSSRTGEVFSYV